MMPAVAACGQPVSLFPLPPLYTEKPLDYERFFCLIWNVYNMNQPEITFGRFFCVCVFVQRLIQRR